MKKILGIICSILICGTIFTSFSPSLDGRAVVADKDVLPQGLFARAFGYLPGDSITVTSLSSKQTVDILVIGAIPGEEGIAILLSPEAAAELGISKSSNNVVKITKRTGQLDEAVAGTAVIGTATEVTDVYAEKDEEEAPSAAPEVIADIIEEEEKPFSVATKTDVPETEEEVVAEAVEEEIETSLAEENPKETVAAVEYKEDTPVEVEKTNEDGVVVITPTEEAEEVVAETTEAAAPEAEKFTVIDGEEVIAGEPVEADDLAAIDEKYEKIAEPFDEELNNAGEYDRIEAEKKLAEEIASEEKKDVIAESLNEADIENSVAAEKTPEEKSNVIAETESSEDESYEPIVLVPANANPPAKDETVAEVIEVTESESSETEVAEEKTAAEEVASAPAKTAEKKSAETINIDKYKVASLADLEKGKFYIQIAMLGNEDNIRSTIKKYGKEYPITLVPLSNGKGYQFLIGSLNMDEYGTVLNRFKSYGYKDAFLRRIK